MNSDLLDDYRWLVGAEGSAWLERIEEMRGSLSAQVKQLRRSLDARRTHLLLEQKKLRTQASNKFENGQRLFFTRRSLEQATDQWVADAKAERFPADRLVYDLCCGIGGDLMQLARQAPATAVDLDPVLALLADTNCRSSGLREAKVIVADAAEVALAKSDAWHIDPDRRSAGRRTTRPTRSEPSEETIDRMLLAAPHAAIKLAPAAELCDRWNREAERQWLGSGRECRQQVAWFGDLARFPQQRSALVVHHRGRSSHLLVGDAGLPIPVTSDVARYLYEPHATVLASGLAGALAAKFSFDAIGSDVAYFTSDILHQDVLFDTFEVTDVLKFDTRKLRAAIRHRGIGQLEVKKRNAPIDPDAVRKKLLAKGSKSATLLVAPRGGRLIGILARRVM